MSLAESAAAAKAASVYCAATDAATKNGALEAVARALQEHRDAIVQANRSDLDQAERDRLAPALLKRLKFDESKIDQVCQGIESLIGLPDPVGRTLEARELDEGLNLYRVTCPIGVIGVIFESRPDALVQISSLCLKSGNAVLLKGGSEAAQTNRILADVIRAASEQAGMPTGWIQLMQTREDVTALLKRDDSVDLIIPRGSNAFVKHIMENTSIPVLGHADGICHVYVDADADLEMAQRITVDAKCQYVAVCNAAETLLVHQQVAAAFLPAVTEALHAKGVEVRGCERSRALVPDLAAAHESDWDTEYLDWVLSVRTVDSLSEAMDFINRHGSGHTDCIVTQNPESAALFMNLVDSGNVFWNCSTRFSDGFRYGLGAEVGISTNKIHARGPVGLDGLMIYKWKLIGRGHVVADYSGPAARRFTHRSLDDRCPL